MKNIKKLIAVAIFLVALTLTSNAQSWGFTSPMGGFGYSNSKRGGQSWGFSLPNGIGFGYSSRGGAIGIGGGGFGGFGGGYVGGGYGAISPANAVCSAGIVAAPKVYYPSTRPIYFNPAGPAVIYSQSPVVVSGTPNFPRGVIIRRTAPARFGQVSYPNVW